MKKLLFSIVVVAFVVAAQAADKKANAVPACCAAKVEAAKAQCPADKAAKGCCAKDTRQALASPKAASK